MTTLNKNLLERQLSDKDKTAIIYYENDHAKVHLSLWQVKEIITETLVPLIDSFEGDLIQLEFDVNHPNIIYIVPCILAVAFSGKCAFYVTSEPDPKGAILSFKNGRYTLVNVTANEPKKEVSEQKFLYHVHTSGTSGGSRRQVKVPISCMWPNVEDFLSVFKLNERDTIFSAAPPSFDPFYLDVFVAFMSGATLLMTSQTNKAQGGAALFQLLENHHVTFCQMTPSLYKNIGSSVPNCFKYLLLGGEAFPQNVQQKDNLKVYNLYGLTEMSVWQSMVLWNGSSDQPIYAHGENLLTNTQLRLEGREIIVQSQSRACFFDGAFHPVVHTKDGGFERDGQIFYSGRLDDVFKIHGRQMTIDQVEKAWQSAFNAPAFCSLLETRHLVAYVQTEATVQSLHEQAAEKLPGHFRPLRVVCNVMPPPITFNGKIDREAIKNMIDNEEVCTIEHLWRRHTGIEPKLSSNFIADGGDSFSAVLIAETLRQPFLVDVLLSKSFSEVKSSVQNQLMNTFKIAKKDDQPSSTEKQSSGKSYPFSLKWRQNMGKCIDGSPILAPPNKVFIGSHKGLFGAFDLASGNQLWKLQLDDRIEATAAVSDGCAFIGTYGGSMYCIEINEGKVMWRNNDSRDIIKTRPLVSGDRLFFSCHDGFVRCLFKADGHLSWMQNVGTSGHLIHHGDLIISANLRGQLHFFDKTSGDEKHSKQLDSPIFSLPVICENNFLIVATVKGLVYCLQLDTMTITWTLDTTDCHIFGPLLYHNNLCFHGSQEGIINAIDAQSGQVRWTVKMANPVQAGMCQLSPEDLFIIDIESNFKIVDLVRGNLKSEGFLNIGKTFSTALMAENNLIIGSRDDHLYAFEIQ